jgi:hypothetical protein
MYLEKKTEREIEEKIRELRESECLVIFGAGLVALEVGSCLTEKPYEFKIAYFVVTEKKENPERLLSVPVIDLAAASEVIPKSATIVIATMEEHLETIVGSLRERGYFHVIPLTFNNDLWEGIRERHYREYRLSQGKAYGRLEEELERQPLIPQEASQESPAERKTVHLYTAKCHVDKELKEDVSRYSFTIPIQVGAALTEKRICEVCDNVGENISHKNQQYCELTALYWMWKNDMSEYLGLGHYRRYFEVEEETLRRLAESGIDVVLPIPILNIPNVRAIYERDHLIEDWKVMLEGIRKLSPEYVESTEGVEKGRYYYAYNMFIMRREILERYCSWLFPILSYCEKRSGREGGGYQNRYLGFLAERLLSIYFMYHEGEYKIAHVRKHFVDNSLLH